MGVKWAGRLASSGASERGVLKGSALMLRAERIEKRRRQVETTLAEVEQKSGVSLSTLRPEQQAVLFAATQVLLAVATVPVLRRLVGYFLLHCGLSLPMAAVSAVMQMGPRALSRLKHTPPAELLTALSRRPAGKQRKLRPEHLGPLCRFLVDHPRCTLREVHDFVRTQLGVSVKRHALRRYFQRYSLGVLREERVDARPLFGVTPPTLAHSSCFARPSA